MGAPLVPIEVTEYHVDWSTGRTWTTTRHGGWTLGDPDPVEAKLDELLDIARRQEHERLMAEHARLTAAFDRRRR